MAIEDNPISNFIVKILIRFPIPIIILSFSMLSILYLIYSIWNRLIITSTIIAWVIILFVVVFGYNLAMYNESTYLILFEIIHPLSDSDKINYFTNCVIEYATQCVESYDLHDIEYFNAILRKEYLKLDHQMLVQLNKEQLDDFSKELVSKTLKIMFYRSSVAYLIIGMTFLVFIFTYTDILM
jgi:hypothetical protein